MDRMRRVNELLKRELGELFERMICSQVDSLVTITEVDTSPDLRQSRVYVSVYGSDEQKQAAMRLIHGNRKEMQSVISRHVKLKYTPKLSFELDGTAESAAHVMELLEKIEREEPPQDEGK